MYSVLFLTCLIQSDTILLFFWGPLVKVLKVIEFVLCKEHADTAEVVCHIGNLY